MTRMIRVTFEEHGSAFLVEKGEMIPGSLSSEEQTELNDLIEQLKAYGDFTVFKDLKPDEIQKSITLKHRRGELEKKKREPQMEWVPVPQEQLHSIMLMIQPNRINTYVENMPNAWIEKLFSQQLTLNIGATGTTALDVESEPETEIPDPSMPEWKRQWAHDPSLSEKHNSVIKAIHAKAIDANKDLLSLVEIKPIPDSPDFILVNPIKYLGDDYPLIDRCLKHSFGEGTVWKSQGRGDRAAHWSIV